MKNAKSRNVPEAITNVGVLEFHRSLKVIFLKKLELYDEFLLYIDSAESRSARVRPIIILIFNILSSENSTRI